MQSRNVAVLQNATSCLVQLLVASRAPDSRCTRCTKYVYIPPNCIFSKHTSLLLIGDVICVLAVHKIGRCHDRTQKYTSPINLVLFSSIPPLIFLLLHFLLCLSTCPFPSLSPYTYLLPTYLPTYLSIFLSAFVHLPLFICHSQACNRKPGGRYSIVLMNRNILISCFPLPLVKNTLLEKQFFSFAKAVLPH